MIVAVDFDDTLVYTGSLFIKDMHNIPPIEGGHNQRLFELLIRFREKGNKVILWTCREGPLLEQAIQFCKERGLEFDAINENVQPNNYLWQPRKIFADYYIDDKNTSVETLRMFCDE